MTRNITLAIDDALLEAARAKAARTNTSVNAVVRDLLRRFVETDGGAEAFETVHARMLRLLSEGTARYADRPSFDREQLYDRDYQRAVGYFENREALLKLIDETEADFGSQAWNREALYVR